MFFTSNGIRSGVQFSDKFLHPFIFRSKDLLRSSLHLNMTAFHEYDLVGYFFGKLHFMCHNDHGHMLLCQFLNNLKHLYRKLRIKCGGRFIKKENLGLQGQCPCNRNSLLLSSGKLARIGICFIGERPFREFLSRYLPTHPGPIRTDTGKIVGEHVGLSFYTLGQRKGIGVGGSREGTGEPWFVARKDLATNTLWIVQGHEHPWLNTHTLKAVRTSWVSGHAPEPGTPVTVKTRYRAPDGACEVASVDSESIDLSFPVPQWAATPGQSAVLYQGEVCLGGGFIDTIDNADIPKIKKA